MLGVNSDMGIKDILSLIEIGLSPEEAWCSVELGPWFYDYIQRNETEVSNVTEERKNKNQV